MENAPSQQCILLCEGDGWPSPFLLKTPRSKGKLIKAKIGDIQDWYQHSIELEDDLSEILGPLLDNKEHYHEQPIFYHQNCGRNYISQRTHTSSSPNKKLRLSSKKKKKRGKKKEEPALLCVYCLKEKLGEKAYEIKPSDSEWNSSRIVKEFRKRLTNHGATPRLNEIEFNSDGNPVNKTGLHHICRLTMMRKIVRFDKRESQRNPAKVREEIYMIHFKPLFHFVDAEVLEKSSAVLLRDLKSIADELGIDWGCGRTVIKYMKICFGERIAFVPHTNPSKGIMIIDASLSQQVLLEKYVLNEEREKILTAAGVKTVDV